MQRVTASTATIKHVRIDGRVSSCYKKHEAILGAGMSIKPLQTDIFGQGICTHDSRRSLCCHVRPLPQLKFRTSTLVAKPCRRAHGRSARTPRLARHKMVDGVDTLTVVSVGRSSTVGNPSLFAVHRRRQSPVVAHRSPSIVRLRW